MKGLGNAFKEPLTGVHRPLATLVTDLKSALLRPLTSLFLKASNRSSKGLLKSFKGAQNVFLRRFQSLVNAGQTAIKRLVKGL